MRIIEREINVKDRNGTIEIYPIGDTHVGARNCAESLLKKTKKEIADNPNAYWIGGGDYLESIKPSDLKRFDMTILPDWMFEGSADTIRGRLKDILSQQADRFCNIFEPLKQRCIGLVEGNHEYSIMKYHNQDIMSALCDRLDTEYLTDEAVVRLKFKHRSLTRIVFLYIQHGHGGGRSDGAEPNHLGRLVKEWECADIVLRGHSHTCFVMPPKPVLYIPTSGRLPNELQCKYRHAANWGTYKLSHAVGHSTYESRAAYPARPMLTCKVVIKPFARDYKNGEETRTPQIEIRSITL
jgi:predicted phosphodiesterase